MGDKDELTLIYHQDCEACKRLINTISSMGDLDLTLINIYDTEISANIEISKVPTLIVNNTEIKIGKEAFTYFNNLNEPNTKEEHSNFGLLGSYPHIPAPVAPPPGKPGKGGKSPK